MEHKVLLLGVEIQFYFVCWVGSLVLFFRLKNENRETWRFLCFINRRWIDQPIVNTVELLMFTIFGSFVGAVLTQPATVPQAFAAGLGWMGLLGSPSNKIPGRTSELGGVRFGPESTNS